MDAANYFDVTGKPEFERNQFGGAIGGPLVRDRLFYFVGYEALRENLGKTISSAVPNDNARLGDAADGTGVHQPGHPAVPGCDSARERPRSGGGLATHTFVFDQTLDQDFFSGRLDYQHGTAHQFFGRYTLDDAVQQLPTDYPAFPRSFISTNQFATLEYRNVLSSNTFQTARFGYSRTRIGQNVEANLASPLPPFVTGRALVGDIDIGGMQRFGPQSSANLRLAQNVYSGQYDLDAHARRPPAEGGFHHRALPRLHDQPDVQPRDLHLREPLDLPPEPAAALRRPRTDRRHQPRLAVDLLRRLRCRTTSRSRRTCRSTPACATKARRCRRTRAIATPP